MASSQIFSEKLASWLSKPGKKTFGQLEDNFAEKSFAVALLLLLAPSALPIPTGGITNILELIALVITVELMLGRRSLWLPSKWRSKELGHELRKKALPKFINFIRWFERYSRPRFRLLLRNRYFLRIVGVITFVFTLGALLSVPFSGLDTLPSLGVVLISLSLLLEDIFIFAAGILFGTIGIALMLTITSSIYSLF